MIPVHIFVIDKWCPVCYLVQSLKSSQTCTIHTIKMSICSSSISFFKTYFKLRFVCAFTNILCARERKFCIYIYWEVVYFPIKIVYIFYIVQRERYIYSCIFRRHFIYKCTYMIVLLCSLYWNCSITVQLSMK